MKRRFPVVAAALLVLVAGQAVADGIFVPLETTASQSDLILVGEVTAAAVPAEFLRRVPGYDVPIKAWYTEYAVTVGRVLRSAPGTKVRKGDRITVVARAKPPAQGRLVVICGGPMYPNLKKGTSYVLLLRRFRAEKGWFLPASPGTVRVATKQNIERVEQAALVEKWPWGPVAGGLQLAFLPRATEVRLRGPYRVRVRGRWVRRPAPAVAYVGGLVAVRNVSGKTIRLCCYAWDRNLSGRRTGEDGKTQDVNLYYGIERVRRKLPLAARNIVTVKPGAVAFLSTWGRGDLGTGFRTDALPGRWTFTLAYTATRTRGPRGEELWTGTIRSAPVNIRFLPPVKR